MPKILSILLTVGLLGAGATTLWPEDPEKPRHRVLVELFTSQG